MFVDLHLKREFVFLSKQPRGNSVLRNKTFEAVKEFEAKLASAESLKPLRATAWKLTKAVRNVEPLKLAAYLASGTLPS